MMVKQQEFERFVHDALPCQVKFDCHDAVLLAMSSLEAAHRADVRKRRAGSWSKEGKVHNPL